MTGHVQRDCSHPKVPGTWQYPTASAFLGAEPPSPAWHLPLCTLPSICLLLSMETAVYRFSVNCILQEEIGLVFAVGNAWRIVKGSQVAGLTFTSVQEAAREPEQRHYRRLRPPVISRLHLATPGAPSSIIDHCLVPTPPSPTTSCQRGLLADKQVLSVS